MPDVKQSFIDIIERMLADSKVRRGRIIIQFAFATLMQQRFKIDFVYETFLIKDCLYNWMTYTTYCHVLCE